MPTVSRRRVVEDEEEERPVSRRRDRARAAEVEEDEEEDVDATERPARARKTTKRSTKKASARRRPAPIEDDEDDEDIEEDDEEEEEPPPRRRKASASKKAAPRSRRRQDAEEDEDEEGDEEEEPPRRSRTAHKSSARTTKQQGPPLHTGLKGAEEVAKAAGGGVVRLTFNGKEPELVKALEKAPFVSFLQHWMPSGPGQGDRPYVCYEVDCPLCETGDRASKTHLFNVLHLSGDGPPTNKILQVSVKAYKAFVAAATPRGKETPIFDRDYWVVTKSGKDQQSQTNFNRIKDEDLDEDWDEIFENFDPDELDDIIEEAKEHLFDKDIVQTHTRKQLREIARYAMAEDDEEE